MLYPTVIQLVRSPFPTGFGGDVLDTTKVQIPVMVMYSVFTPVAVFIISKIGTIKPLIGISLTTLGSLSLWGHNYTGTEASMNLAMVSTGLASTNTSTLNLLAIYSSKEFFGVSYGMGSLFTYLGMSVLPALSPSLLHAIEISISGSLYPDNMRFQ